MKKKFAIIGVAGFIAKKHVEAIKKNNQELVLACDMHDNVGFLDKYYPDCKFTKSINFFFKEVKKKKVDYVVICTPNYLHFQHINKSLKSGAKIICEKPLVIKKSEFNKLIKLNKKHRDKINIILQLRLNKNLIKIYKFIKKEKKINKLSLDYITPRGRWYNNTWKNDKKKSGGIKLNIGVHLFDIISKLFGPIKKIEIIDENKRKIRGKVLFKKKLNLKFMLSINHEDLPLLEKKSYRVLSINNKKFDLTKSFTDLHTESYKNILENNGFKVETYSTVYKLLD